MNSGNGANLFDFDQDGIVNLLEYAFGMNPTQTYNPNSPLENFPRPQFNGGNFGYTFTANVSGVSYRGEWSATLQPHDWHPILDTGSGSQHVFMMPVAGHAKLFMRLAVTVP